MQNQLLTAAFFMEGLRDVKPGYMALLERWNQGAIELVNALVGYVPFTNHLSETVGKTQESWPGVFDYEVSSCFGNWFGEYIMEHGDQPPQKEAHEYLVKEIQAFFSQCCTTDEAEAVKQIIQQSYEGAIQ